MYVRTAKNGAPGAIQRAIFRLGVSEGVSLGYLRNAVNSRSTRIKERHRRQADALKGVM